MLTRFLAHQFGRKQQHNFPDTTAPLINEDQDGFSLCYTTLTEYHAGRPPLAAAGVARNDVLEHLVGDVLDLVRADLLGEPLQNVLGHVKVL